MRTLLLLLHVAGLGLADGMEKPEPGDPDMLRHDNAVVFRNPSLLCNREVHSRGRVDCHPELYASREKCEARSCCWHPPSRDGPEGTPYCYFPLGYPSYNVTSSTQEVWGRRYVLTGGSQSSPWPAPVTSLHLDLRFEAKERLRIKIYDATRARYEVPITTPDVTQAAQDTLYDVDVTSWPVGIKVTRKSTSATIFDTSIVLAPLLFSDQYIQLTAATSASTVYGLGEHEGGLATNLTQFYSYSYWNRDQPPVPNTDLYGDFPFYMGFEGDSSDAHGVFLLNSNAMEIVLQPQPSITYRTIGGILDFYIMLGPRPSDVAQQYAAVVGHPAMPPFWALGFHLCRWGYHNDTGLEMVINRTLASGIPYDTQWTDIDYMSKHMDFTHDTDRFARLPQIVDELHNRGQRYVVIMDPAISSTQQTGRYPPYDDGLARGVFVTSAGSDQPIIGKVWPGNTAFPDFTKPVTQEWWRDHINKFHDKIPFDGLWVDMNEPSSFVDGSVHGCTNSSLDHPPYTPGVGGLKLWSRTLCPSAQHHAGSHYDLHNLYGLTEMNATHRALEAVLNERPLVISRSTFSSAGRYGGHWSGDVFSTWKQLYYSVPEMLRFNMYAVPLVGADICGFMGNTEEELCLRWMQLGAFYPFMRNHNTLGARAQDPGVWSRETQQRMADVTILRYQILPLLYTLLHHAHSLGQPPVRALLYNYPEDPNVRGLDRQFMWGDKLLVCPVLEEGARSVRAYLPAGTWYTIMTSRNWVRVESGGKWVTVDAPLDTIPVYLRAGSVIAAKDAGASSTTTKLREKPFELVFALDTEGGAEGDLFWDDGKSIGTYENKRYLYVSFNCSESMCRNNVGNSGYGPVTADGFTVIGVQTMPTVVTLNSQRLNATFVPAIQGFVCGDLSINLAEPFEIKWQ